MLKERITRRTLLKVAGGLALTTVLDLRVPGSRAATVTRTEWKEQGVFPPSGRYQSPVLRADHDFNSVEVGWLADLPEGSALDFAVRLSADGSSWSGWIDLHQDAHLQAAGSNLSYAAPVLSAPMRAVQYRVDLVPNSLGQDPTLREVRVNGVDTSAPAQFLDAGGDLIDGFIIPRAGWGADESLRFDKDGDEVWPPEYQEIQKVVIHHTVTQNKEANPAATMRAIYYYHAVTLGWGDIGYNFLVDWKGNVYEGRFGGRNVIGGHALQYNRGSMGVAVLGTYELVEPEQASLDALVRIIKDRAANVDPGVWSFFIDKPNVPNICGHRDVLQTDCPGDDLYAQLPYIRGWVKGTGPITQPDAKGPSSAQIISVAFAPTSVYAGMPIKVDAVIKNTSSTTIYGQDPQPGSTYVEGMDFNTAGFPKIEGSYRLGVDFSGNSGLPSPFRWGLPAPLDPGKQVEITGYIRLASAGTHSLTANLIQEYIRYVQKDVGAQQVTIKVPPSVAAAPKSDDPTMVYFDVTQHNVPAVFYNYWEQNGGLTRFGYPLTEPFDEASATDGQSYTTQYFERARFEHHPENKGTKYEVLLGLLGSETTTNRLQERPFQPIAPVSATPDRDYFAETGHSLIMGFRSYWYDNGGLPIFGYPLSEEFQELSKTDGQQHTVQYFERARFEWHPEYRGTQYEYLLGHLGREILIDRGWLKGAGAS